MHWDNLRPALTHCIDSDNALFNRNIKRQNNVVHWHEQQKQMTNTTLIIHWMSYLCLETSTEVYVEPLTWKSPGKKKTYRGSSFLCEEIKWFMCLNEYPSKGNFHLNRKMVLNNFLMRGNQAASATFEYDIIVEQNHTSSLGNSLGKTKIPPAAPWLPIPVIHIRSQIKTRQSQSYKF